MSRAGSRRHVAFGARFRGARTLLTVGAAASMILFAAANASALQTPGNTPDSTRTATPANGALLTRDLDSPGSSARSTPDGGGESADQTPLPFSAPDTHTRGRLLMPQADPVIPGPLPIPNVPPVPPGPIPIPEIEAPAALTYWLSPGARAEAVD
jgi:hypothetical protein